MHRLEIVTQLVFGQKGLQVVPQVAADNRQLQAGRLQALQQGA
jgi:hypothetical protein